MFTGSKEMEVISLAGMLAGLIPALAIGGGIALCYRFTHRGPGYDRSFPVSLILSSAIVCFVIQAIGGNVVLSVGMLGALSIVRFRTAVRDSRDMLYLFWAIAVGLACGTGHALQAAAFSAILALVDGVFARLQGSEGALGENVIVVKGTGAVPEAFLQEIAGRLWEGRVSTRSADLANGEWELVLEAFGKRPPPAGEVLGEIGRVPGVLGVSILSSRALP